MSILSDAATALSKMITSEPLLAVAARAFMAVKSACTALRQGAGRFWSASLSVAGEASVVKRLACVCLAGVALAMLLPSTTQPLRAQTATNAMRVMPGDKLLVTVFGQTQLSGKFLIDTTGAIDMPVVGRVAVAELTVEEARKKIERELAQGIVNTPSVSVSIDEYRPIYVFGFVKTPGAYPFRPSVTAVGAYIVGGGEPNMELATSMAMSELVNSDERVKLFEARRNKLAIRVAGLEAQRDRAATVDFSQLTSEQRASADVNSMMKLEQQRVAAETKARDGDLALLTMQRPMLSSERAGLAADVSAQTRLLEVNKNRLAEYSNLARKGLDRGSVMMELNQQVANSEAAISKSKALLSRNEVDQSALELKINERSKVYFDKVLELLNTARQDLGEIEIQLASARQLRELRRQATGQGQGGMANVSYTVQRRVNGSVVRLPAEASTPLEPGDIVEVRNAISDALLNITQQNKAPARIQPAQVSSTRANKS